MPRLRDATRLERRRAFIGAARRREASQGWSVMTVDDVCAEAGLSKGAFYSHFPSKQALLYALLEDDAAQVTSLMTELEMTVPDRLERLRRLSRGMLTRAEDPARGQLLADLWSAVLTEPEVRRRVQAAVVGHRQVIRRWVEEAVAAGEMAELPSNALAAILLALNDGLVLHRTLDAGGFRWANVGRAVDALLEGVRVR
jgi:AcrR family transcriptional regulator